MIAFARAKLDVLSDEDLAAVEGVTDPSVLTELITALGQARSDADARAALFRAIAR